MSSFFLYAPRPSKYPISPPTFTFNAFNYSERDSLCEIFQIFRKKIKWRENHFLNASPGDPPGGRESSKYLFLSGDQSLTTVVGYSDSPGPAFRPTVRRTLRPFSRSRE